MPAFTPWITALALGAALLGCAQPPVAPAHNHGETAAAPAGGMGAMQAHMAKMREMRQAMAQAKTPAEREALMAEHMKAMDAHMAAMEKGMGQPGGMKSMTPDCGQAAPAAKP